MKLGEQEARVPVAGLPVREIAGLRMWAATSKNRKWGGPWNCVEWPGTLSTLPHIPTHMMGPGRGAREL